MCTYLTLGCICINYLTLYSKCTFFLLNGFIFKKKFLIIFHGSYKIYNEFQKNSNRFDMYVLKLVYCQNFNLNGAILTNSYKINTYRKKRVYMIIPNNTSPNAFITWYNHVFHISNISNILKYQMMTSSGL